VIEFLHIILETEAVSLPVGNLMSTLIHSQTSIHLIGPLLPILAGTVTSL